MAEAGEQPLDEDIDDYLYFEEIYVDRLPESFSCPICLCPVQRAAHLTQCCGNHFCLACIDRVRSEGKPCPMCNGRPVVIFPNKERQREINQLKVLCPLRDEDEVDGGCDWTGELAQMYSHVFENHTNDHENAEGDAGLEEIFEQCQIEDLPSHKINHSTASSSLEIPSDETRGVTGHQMLVLSSSNLGTPIHPAGGGITVLVSSPDPVTQVTVVQGHQTPQVVPPTSISPGQPSGQSEINLHERDQKGIRRSACRPPISTSHHQGRRVITVPLSSKPLGRPSVQSLVKQRRVQRQHHQSLNTCSGLRQPPLAQYRSLQKSKVNMLMGTKPPGPSVQSFKLVEQGQCQHVQKIQSPKKVCTLPSGPRQPPISPSQCHHQKPKPVMPPAMKSSSHPQGQSVVNVGQGQRHKKVRAHESRPPVSSLPPSQPHHPNNQPSRPRHPQPHGSPHPCNLKSHAHGPGHPQQHPHGPSHPHPHPHGPRPGAHRPGHPQPHPHGPKHPPPHPHGPKPHGHRPGHSHPHNHNHGPRHPHPHHQ